MTHPELDNRTPFAFAPLLVADEDGRPLVAPIVKATFDVSATGELSLAGDQLDVDFAGEHHGEPGESSYRLEPETAFVKLATDVVLLGHAVAPRAGTTQMEVRFRVGPVAQAARVTGDRSWQVGRLAAKATAPVPFERIPLIYERAFGGWDRTPDDPAHHDCEPRNPVGVGFAARRGKLLDGAPIPNIEDPKSPMKGHGGRHTPVGFGFVSPDWQPRAGFAGTYDDAWLESRSPRLPADFDRRYFNSASVGLVAPGYLEGTESVDVVGATASGRWQFDLPGLAAPRCLVALRFDRDRELVTHLDTVVVDADAMRVTLLWRAFTLLRSGPHDVRAMRVTCANAPSQETAASPASRAP